MTKWKRSRSILTTSSISQRPIASKSSLNQNKSNPPRLFLNLLSASYRMSSLRRRISMCTMVFFWTKNGLLGSSYVLFCFLICRCQFVVRHSDFSLCFFRRALKMITLSVFMSTTLDRRQGNGYTMSLDLVVWNENIFNKKGPIYAFSPTLREGQHVWKPVVLSMLLFTTNYTVFPIHRYPRWKLPVYN